MKPYDFKILLEKFKARGLDVAEDSAMYIVEEVFSWLKESATLSETPYDDLLVVIYPQVEKFLKEQADKINGKTDLE